MSPPTLYCTFRSAGQLYGVPILDVKEVTTETTCTRIPHAPAEVRGYVNIRGHVFLALDIRRLLGLPGETSQLDRRLVIFKATVGPSFGVLVDEIGDIVAVSTEQTENLRSSNPDGTEQRDRNELVTRLCKLPDELLIALDPRRFLAIIERASPVA